MLELQQRKKALAAGIYEAGRQRRLGTRRDRYRAPLRAARLRSSPVRNHTTGEPRRWPARLHAPVWRAKSGRKIDSAFEIVRPPPLKCVESVTYERDRAPPSRAVFAGCRGPNEANRGTAGASQRHLRAAMAPVVTAARLRAAPATRRTPADRAAAMLLGYNGRIAQSCRAIAIRGGVVPAFSPMRTTPSR